MVVISLSETVAMEGVCDYVAERMGGEEGRAITVRNGMVGEPRTITVRSGVQGSVQLPDC